MFSSSQKFTLGFHRYHRLKMNSIKMFKNLLKVSPQIWISGNAHFFSRTKTLPYSVVKPAEVSPTLSVPSNIDAPNYSSLKRLRSIHVKSPEEIIKMRDSCQLASKVLKLAGEFVKEGNTTDFIDKKVHEMIIAHNAYPSPLNYRGFPKSICTSVNNVAVHGIPDSRPLEEGDLITIDITVYYNGFHGDCAATYAVGNLDKGGQSLMEAARSCRDEAIKICGPGVRFSLIGNTIERLASKLGFYVVPDLCGHGIGRNFHEPPEIFHFRNAFFGEMQEGMTFTIEPVISESCQFIKILEDGWTAVTRKNSRTSQFEHTILITKQGVEILTLPVEN